MIPDKYKEIAGVVCEEVFQIMLSGYLVFLLIDTVAEGLITNYVNLNILLVIIIISEIGMSAFPVKRSKINEELNEDQRFTLSFVASLITVLIIYYKTKNLGNISLPVSLVSGVLVFLLSKLTLNEKTEDL